MAGAQSRAAAENDGAPPEKKQQQQQQQRGAPRALATPGARAAGAAGAAVAARDDGRPVEGGRRGSAATVGVTSTVAAPTVAPPAPAVFPVADAADDDDDAAASAPAASATTAAAAAAAGLGAAAAAGAPRAEAKERTNEDAAGARGRDQEKEDGEAEDGDGDDLGKDGEEEEEEEEEADDDDDEDNDVPGEPHPLQFRWSLWHDQPPRSSKAAWGAELREIATFGTVEDFWALFNNLLDPSRLPVGQTYSLFKHGMRPEWEDPGLKQGGEWRVQVTRDTVDQAWVDTVLALIGEAFDAPESDDIAGLVLNIRKGSQHRIAIWTKGVAGDEVLLNIANRWRQVAIQSSDQIEYLSFQMVKNKIKKPKFVV